MLALLVGACGAGHPIPPVAWALRVLALPLVLGPVLEPALAPHPPQTWHHKTPQLSHLVLQRLQRRRPSESQMRSRCVHLFVCLF